MEVIPAINEENFRAVSRRIRQAEELGSEWVEVDVGDGRFGEVRTWRKPEELAQIETPLKVAIHFMVQNPEDSFKEWLRPPVQRLVFHAETTAEAAAIRDGCLAEGVEPGLAVAVGSGWETLERHLGEFGFFQILAVTPGRSGQKFNEQALELVTYLRSRRSDVKIEVDGGINPETAKMAKEAGADIVVASSYIFESRDIKEAYQRLVRI